MSTAAREMLATGSKLSFAHPEVDLSDIRDPNRTDTLLIQMLLDLVHRSPRPLLITALNTDHPTFDGGPHGHGHNAGLSVDLWHSDYKKVGDTKIVDVMKAVADCPYVWTVGLGGIAKKYLGNVAFPEDGKLIVFADNDDDHIHLQAANDRGSGLR